MISENQFLFDINVLPATLRNGFSFKVDESSYEDYKTMFENLRLFLTGQVNKITSYSFLWMYEHLNLIDVASVSLGSLTNTRETFDYAITYGLPKVASHLFEQKVMTSDPQFSNKRSKAAIEYLTNVSNMTETTAQNVKNQSLATTFKNHKVSHLESLDGNVGCDGLTLNYKSEYGGTQCCAFLHSERRFTALRVDFGLSKCEISIIVNGREQKIRREESYLGPPDINTIEPAVTAKIILTPFDENEATVFICPLYDENEIEMK